MTHEAFDMGGGQLGCLLIHGFSGSPAEMRGLGKQLADAHHRVLGVKLAGHTTNPADLAGTSWRDWLGSAEAAFGQLQSSCAAVDVVGFSLGGALAALLASRRRVRRLVLLATPKRLSNDWRIGLLPVAKYVMPWFYPLQQANFSDPRLRAMMQQKDPTLNLDDPAVQQTLRTAVKIPVAAIDEAARAVRQAYAVLPKLDMPTLVMQGRDDETVPLSADEVYARLGTRDKQLVWWERTGHQLLSSPQRNAIYARIAEFLR